MKKIKGKIKFYKGLLVEVIETLISICMYLEREGFYNPMSESMYSHANRLKEFSEELREQQ